MVQEPNRSRAPPPAFICVETLDAVARPRPLSPRSRRSVGSSTWQRHAARAQQYDDCTAAAASAGLPGGGQGEEAQTCMQPLAWLLCTGGARSDAPPRL